MGLNSRLILETLHRVRVRNIVIANQQVHDEKIKAQKWRKVVIYHNNTIANNNVFYLDTINNRMIRKRSSKTTLLLVQVGPIT